MSDRDFPFIKLSIDGQVRSAFRITCGKCGATEDFLQTGARRCPPIAAEQHFRRHGWVIGARSSVDRCPSCWGATQKPRAMKALADLKLIVNEQEPSVQVTAEKPEGPSREERRIIFAKLQDVYLDERQGYDAGWSDHRVAEDLGVPRAWVATIRDENFGPAKDNAEIREFLNSLQAIEAEYLAVKKQAEGAQAAANALGSRLKDLERLAKNVRAQIAA